MKKIEIKNFDELKSLDLSNLEILEDISIDIKLKLIDENIDFPIKIFHQKPNFSSEIKIKLALYGKSKVNIPAEILVKSGAKDTSTNFKALVYLMDPKSHANVTPGLLIHDKNIKSAGHGVVIKNIKDSDTFYLQSRGINKDLSKDLIIGI